MENYLQAILLGLIQGLTEFFPVSSSGHLVLAQHLMGLEEPEIFFDLMLHLGTLAAVLLFLRHEIIMMVKSLFLRGEDGAEGRKLLWLVIVASIPTAVIGLCFRSTFMAMFSSIFVVGLALVLTALLLLLTKCRQPGKDIKLKNMSWIMALVVGTAQGLAITPGLSRSGTTIAVGLLLGLNRELAFKFSFLISIPAIVGASLLESLNLSHAGGAMPAGSIMAGTVVAAISGLVALILVKRLVNSGHIWWFFPYCLILGIIAMVAA